MAASTAARYDFVSDVRVRDDVRRDDVANQRIDAAGRGRCDGCAGDSGRFAQQATEIVAADRGVVGRRVGACLPQRLKQLEAIEECVRVKVVDPLKGNFACRQP